MLRKPQEPDTSTLGRISVAKYVLNDLMRIRGGEIANTLRFIHFTHVEKLLYFLRYYIKNSINIEFCCRVLYFIMQNHEGNIMNSPKLVKVV